VQHERSLNAEPFRHTPGLLTTDGHPTALSDDPVMDSAIALLQDRGDRPLPLIYHDVASVARQSDVVASLPHLARLFQDEDSQDGYRRALDAICVFFADETTSDKNSDLVVGYVHDGVRHSTTLGRLRTVLKPTIRSFMRSLADYTRGVLRQLARPSRFALVNNFPPNFYELGFDYAEYCSGLTPNQLSFINRVKGLTLRGQPSYEQAFLSSTPTDPWVQEGQP